MNYNLQRKYRSLERRREPKKMPKLPKLPEKVFYRILDDGDQSRGKKHVKFQLLGEEDDDAKAGMLCSDFSPVPARYCASSVHRTRTRLIPCTWISFCWNDVRQEERLLLAETYSLDSFFFLFRKYSEDRRADDLLIYPDDLDLGKRQGRVVNWTIRSNHCFESLDVTNKKYHKKYLC